MSGSNPFDDLAEEVAGGDRNDPAEAGSTTDAAGADDGRSAGGTASRDGGSDPGGSDGADAAPGADTVAGPTLENSSPPFPYSETEQKQMYVRGGLWDEFEDLGFDAELELRRTFDVRNVEQREIDTALVRLALERFSPDEIAAMVVRTRGFDPSDGE
ncbi:hypothetical protein [Candidatus Halobonum tyrrellensis]|uniref:Uncharacterized protein n=1 Tax=Candidatus Halobonum tyrrellensis G22 TaxID=1324957 RepID=V4J451_9EURY|nr:hypothetical protein [Candidatus Halobonum tyrrellensis]ESP90152.1 hypothetical protein K933_01287 [Candidatus Halobonum tyrrellensis G22]